MKKWWTGLGESVGVFADLFEELLVLEIEEDGGFFDLAGAEDAADDFFAGEGFGGIFEDGGDDVGDGAFGVSPSAEGVDAAADQDEAGVFDELVVDGLDGDILAAEAGLSDGIGDFGKVHGFFLGLEDDEDFVANVARVDRRPAGKSPEVVKRSELFGKRGDGLNMVRVFII